MLFTFLITIVFIAEIIVAIAIINCLLKLDRKINDFNSLLEEAKPSIKDISILARKISLQVVELTKKYVQSFEQSRDEIILRQIAKFILGTLFFNKLRKSKLGRSFSKGLSLLQIVI